MKDSSSLITTGSMKSVVNSNKNLLLTGAEGKDPDKCLRWDKHLNGEETNKNISISGKRRSV